MTRWIITGIVSAILGLFIVLAGTNLGGYRQPYLFLGIGFIAFAAGIMLKLSVLLTNSTSILAKKEEECHSTKEIMEEYFPRAVKLRKLKMEKPKEFGSRIVAEILSSAKELLEEDNG